ncbi:MAG: hypothetical protein PHD56_11040 [Anaerostipes sp.]|nr:hypothetical protein [Anaerostipes sp.]
MKRFLAVTLCMVMAFICILPAEKAKAAEKSYDAIKSIKIGSKTFSKSTSLGNGTKPYASFMYNENATKGKISVTPKSGWKIQELKLLCYTDPESGDALEDGPLEYGKTIKQKTTYKFSKYDTFLGILLKNEKTGKVFEYEMHWRPYTKVKIYYRSMRNNKTTFKIDGWKFTYSKKSNLKKDDTKFKSRSELVKCLRSAFGYKTAKIKGKNVHVYLPKSHEKFKVSVSKPGKGTSIKISK